MCQEEDMFVDQVAALLPPERNKLYILTAKVSFFSYKFCLILLFKKVVFSSKHTARFLNVPFECYSSQPDRNSLVVQS